MTKDELKFGMILELQDGCLCLLEPIYNYSSTKAPTTEEYKARLRDIKTASYVADLSDFNNNLEYDPYDAWINYWTYDTNPVIKVYEDYTLKNILWKREEKEND